MLVEVSVAARASLTRKLLSLLFKSHQLRFVPVTLVEVNLFIIAHLRAVSDVLQRHRLIIMFLQVAVLLLVFILEPDRVVLEELLRRCCLQQGWQETLHLSDVLLDSYLACTVGDDVLAAESHLQLLLISNRRHRLVHHPMVGFLAICVGQWVLHRPRLLAQRLVGLSSRGQPVVVKGRFVLVDHLLGVIQDLLLVVTAAN